MWKAFFETSPPMYESTGDSWDTVLASIENLKTVAVFIEDKVFVVRMTDQNIEAGPEGFVEISKCGVSIEDMVPTLTLDGTDTLFGFTGIATGGENVTRRITITESGTVSAVLEEGGIPA